jgi:hypothetical protein
MGQVGQTILKKGPLGQTRGLENTQAHGDRAGREVDLNHPFPFSKGLQQGPKNSQASSRTLGQLHRPFHSSRGVDSRRRPLTARLGGKVRKKMVGARETAEEKRKQH